MKFVFIDKNETEVQFIKNVLSKWNVPYHVITQEKEDRGFFGYEDTLYNIEINVEYEFYEFLRSEIDKVQTLENCLSLQYKPQHNVSAKNNTVKPKNALEAYKQIKTNKKEQKANNFLQNLIEHMMKGFEEKGLVEKRPNKDITDLLDFLENEDLFSIKINPIKQDLKQVKFDDLTPQEQKMLKRDFPEEILRKSTTIIYKSGNSLSICIDG